MAIRSFKDRDDALFFSSGKMPRKKGWAGLAAVVKRKLDMVHYAKELSDLKSPPSNYLESLSGDLKGFYSIRVNNQWRVVFKWDDGPYDVQVVDYH
ncbi:MAG: type II toxin-antitoxin system RelE/ParE family toxin [Verrucomicrobia bacterium]|nr:type II toxin-antitoxin system RelE/ParE family toxin [Verrucomicrobiota bacterium]